MKFCKDCRHIRGGMWRDAECAGTPRPRNIDLVSGRVWDDPYWLCAAARDRVDLCGPDARYFEPRA